jgi:hypothetical protein
MCVPCCDHSIMESDVESVAAANSPSHVSSRCQISSHIVHHRLHVFVSSIDCCMASSCAVLGDDHVRSKWIPSLPLGVFLSRRVGFFLPGASTLQSKHRFLAVAFTVSTTNAAIPVNGHFPLGRTQAVLI